MMLLINDPCLSSYAEDSMINSDTGIETDNEDTDPNPLMTTSGIRTAKRATEDDNATDTKTEEKLALKLQLQQCQRHHLQHQ